MVPKILPMMSDEAVRASLAVESWLQPGVTKHASTATRVRWSELPLFIEVDERQRHPRWWWLPEDAAASNYSNGSVGGAAAFWLHYALSLALRRDIDSVICKVPLVPTTLPTWSDEAFQASLAVERCLQLGVYQACLSSYPSGLVRVASVYRGRRAPTSPDMEVTTN